MVTMFVRHTVSDYQAWRKIYDDFAPIQKAKGVEAQAVYQAADNPNDIIVTQNFAAAAAAQTFVKSEELKKAMQKAIGWATWQAVVPFMVIVGTVRFTHSRRSGMGVLQPCMPGGARGSRS